MDKDIIDKILKKYLSRTIAVNQFGLRNELLEALKEDREKEHLMNISKRAGQEFYAEWKKKYREDIKRDFIHEFCNDHNGEPRWLRGIAFDMPDLLEQILDFFDKHKTKSLT